MTIETYFGLLAVALAGLLCAVLVSSKLLSTLSGPAILLFVAVLAPFQTPSGLNACVLLVPALLVSGLLRQMLSGRGVRGYSSPAVAAAMVFIAVALLSFVVGQYPWFPTGPAPMRAQLGGLALFILSAGLFLYIGHQIGTTRQLERLTTLFIWLGAAAVVTSEVGRLNFSIGPIAIIDDRSIGSVFWTWIVAMSMGQALFNERLSSGQRMAMAAVGTMALVRGLVLAFSWTSGWLPPLIALGMLLVMRLPKFTVSLGLVAIAPLLVIWGTMFQVYEAGESYSAMTRGEAARVMWQLIQHNPWLGYGPANYYHYTLLFPILGWWVRFNSHNNYLDLVAQVGVVGLLVFFWMMWEFFKIAISLITRVPKGFPTAYVYSSIAGLIATLLSGLLADWIIPFTYNIGLTGFRSSLLFWFFMGGLLALKRTLMVPGPVTPVPTVESRRRMDGPRDLAGRQLPPLPDFSFRGRP